MDQGMLAGHSRGQMGGSLLGQCRTQTQPWAHASCPDVYILENKTKRDMTSPCSFCSNPLGTSGEGVLWYDFSSQMDN